MHANKSLVFAKSVSQLTHQFISTEEKNLCSDSYRDVLTTSLVNIFFSLFGDDHFSLKKENNC